MHKKDKVQQALLHQKLLPLYYHNSAAVSTQILKALYDGGVRIVEYTNRGEAAPENFSILRSECDNNMPGMLLGIGTIKTKKEAKSYIEAGADFIVCPTINEAVGEAVEKEGGLWIPGCMTPTEIAKAESAGADLVKIFPGHLLGPSYITAVKDLFPTLKFVVTGGVEAEAQNLNAWFKAGVVGVGMGSKLITKDIVERQDYETLKEATAKALALVQEAAQNVR